VFVCLCVCVCACACACACVCVGWMAGGEVVAMEGSGDGVGVQNSEPHDTPQSIGAQFEVRPSEGRSYACCGSAYNHPRAVTMSGCCLRWRVVLVMDYGSVARWRSWYNRRESGRRSGESLFVCLSVLPLFWLLFFFFCFCHCFRGSYLFMAQSWDKGRVLRRGHIYAQQLFDIDSGALVTGSGYQ
jgi:hypothetical protein